MTSIWDELLIRVQYIRDLCQRLKIAPIPGEGLAQDLDEAEALGRGTKRETHAPEADALTSVRAFNSVWALSDSLRECENAGLSIASRLRQMTTGSTDYGVPSDAASAYRMIYYKDFEAELFVAAALARAGLPVEFLEEPNDPRGDLRVQEVFVEVKHPNSSKTLERLMRKFNAQMQNAGTAGIFVTALEGAFRLASPATFSSTSEYASWKDEKDDQIETFGMAALLRAAGLQNIGALAQTSSCAEIINGSARFIRRANAVLYDERSYSATVTQTILRIAEIFNPHPTRFSEVRKALAGT